MFCYDIIDFLTSQDHLHLSIESVQSKISGIVGDGAFCKYNAPFKNQMKKHFGDNFKFRWDLLHLVNRAHIDCLAQVKELKQLLDFIQNHSSELRTGLKYTELVLDNLIGFRRPKLKSETRMVNFEFEQCKRFVENSKFFYHPLDKETSAKCYVLLCYVTKIILQISQKLSVKSSFFETIF